ncbi:hypothetical protein IJG29_03395 [Candidatus Saccharibacteria bacterium]|nr:hypothetical protein [Candidatus Saccharibacteria bacterium]MBQ3445739.1 hypothetical protein [Candidatus Saccharibacteria bacterium]
MKHKINHHAKHFTNKICIKTNRKPRYTAKSELRYRIMENTMRGYFNYSI